MQIVSDSGGFMYALTTGGGVFQHQGGLNWQLIGAGVSNLSVDGGGEVYGLNPTLNTLFIHNSGINWSPVTTPVPDDTVIQGNANTTLYYVYQGQKHPISAATLGYLGLPTSAIDVLPQTEVDSISTGAPFMNN